MLGTWVPESKTVGSQSTDQNRDQRSRKSVAAHQRHREIRTRSHRELEAWELRSWSQSHTLMVSSAVPVDMSDKCSKS